MSDIQQHIERIGIIDGHEHLATPQIRLKENHNFFSLLHYLDSDLITAGMKRGELNKHSASDDEQKATAFLHYWEKTKNTTYARMFKTAMEDLYDLREWTVKGIMEANHKVLAATRDPDWYHKVMVEKSRIDLAFTLIQTTHLDYERFLPIMFMDFTFNLRTLKDIYMIEENSGLPIKGFRSYLDAVDALLYRFVQEGMVATKLGHAYWRSLRSSKPAYSEVESIFNRLLKQAEDTSFTPEELLPFQDYLIHFIIQRSTFYDLPIQIHTGHHETSVSGNGNIITNSNVEGLIPLLLEYPDAKFVLLHCGMPYHHAYLSIAKNFPNVYTDCTWIYIISPTVAKQILHQMIEMVPQNKIQGFGGDYNFIEGTYAHQKLARKIVGEVLKEKVEDGALDEREAISFADRIFRGNLIELYKLEGLA